MLIIIRNLFALVNAMNFYCIKHDIIVGLSKITTSLILFINKYEHTNHDTYMFYIFNLYKKLILNNIILQPVQFYIIYFKGG